jgi:hypothetical protein
MKNTSIYAAITLVLVIFLYSCSDTDNPIVNNYPESQLTGVNGTVQGWTFGQMKIYSVVYDSTYTSKVILDSGYISPAGEFNLKLTAAPGNLLNEYYIPVGAFCGGSITVEPVNTRSAFLDIEIRDSFGVVIGTLTRKDTSNPSAKIAYAYFDRYTIVKGKQYCTPGLQMDSVIYDMINLKGWNVISTNKFNSGFGITSTYNTNNEPAGSIWIFRVN